ncbi:lysylphosphatidylglycerol synthase domain-containing protein [Sorangium atrum]|uniref:Lysylphosphatidylglycerol synthase domain-containing protein n=1 Tax=Sorangium atrum TaxID=2995308 RepID=A0ABT5CBZ3_9BACT|nr:lysylphosphatidylglycerol synthase domain-containing protein [Sorangium aterium]MDC0683907.1 lysylphosphatidylglycerol synthase domain-containing protein [Sorangium aterium]
MKDRSASLVDLTSTPPASAPPAPPMIAADPPEPARDPPGPPQGIGGPLARVRTTLRPVMVVAVALFIGLAARDLARKWESGEPVDVRPAFVALAVLPLALGVVVLGLAWAFVLEELTGRPIPRWPAIALHIESQAARYIPGKLGVPLVRMLGAPRIGTTSAVVASSFAVEFASFVAVGAMVGFGLLAAGGEQFAGASALIGRWKLPLLVALGAVLVALMTVDRARAPERVRKLLAAEGRGPLMPVRLPLVHAAYWLTWAAHGACAALAVGATPGAALGGSGLFVLAPVAGFLAMATPGGIGVREALLSVGLAPAVGPAAALGAAVISRATSLAVDVGGLLLARLLCRRPPPR